MQKYPLEVQRAMDITTNPSEDYMTIKTTLDLQRCTNKNAIKTLVEKHGFRVCSETECTMEIEGLFPALMKLKDELLYILSVGYKSDQLPPRGANRNITANEQNFVGSEMAVCPWTPRGTEMQHTPLELQKYADRLPRDTNRNMTAKELNLVSSEKAVRPRTPRGTETPHMSLQLQKYAGRKDYAMKTGANEPLINSPPDCSPLSHSSSHHGPTYVPAYVQDHSVTGFHGSMADFDVEPKSLVQERHFGHHPLAQNLKDQPLKRSLFDVYTPSLLEHSKYPSSVSRSMDSLANSSFPQATGLSECITVDGDTLKYIQSFKKKELNDILESESVQMDTVDGGEISHVTLSSISLSTSARMERTSRKVSDFLSNMQMFLRTQDIPLSGISPEKQHMIIETSQKLATQYCSLVILSKEFLRLIGPSRDVFLLKQNLIEQFALNDWVFHSESPNEHLAGSRGRRDRSCPASERKPTTGSFNYDVGETHSYLAVQTTEGQARSTDREAVKSERPRRPASLGRAKHKEILGAPAALPQTSRATDLADFKSGERGRERNRNFFKPALKVINNYKLKRK
ncbi:uncharacterized protein [Ambystoma mexicanum]